MRVAAIGYNPGHPAIEPLAFAERRSLLNFDAVLWRPQGLIDEYRDGYTQPSDSGKGPLLSVRASNELLADARRRREEIRRLLSRGRVLVVVPPPTVALRVHTIEDVLEFDLLDPLPGAPGRTASALEPSLFRGGHPFRGFAERVDYAATAAVAFDIFPGQPLFFGADSGAVHGGYIYRHPGHLLLMPMPRPDDLVPLHEALLLLLGAMENQSFAINLPDWATAYRLDGEEEARDEVRRLLAEQEGVISQLEIARHRLRDIDLKKALFAGGGNTLIQAVAHAFRDLGTIVLPGLLTEDSIVVEDDDRFLVVQVIEAKGEADALDRLDNALNRFGTDFHDSAKGVLLHSQGEPSAEGEAEPLTDLLARRAAVKGYLYLTGLDLVHLSGAYEAAAALELLFGATGHPLVYDPCSPPVRRADTA